MEEGDPRDTTEQEHPRGPTGRRDRLRRGVTSTWAIVAAVVVLIGGVVGVFTISDQLNNRSVLRWSTDFGFLGKDDQQMPSGDPVPLLLRISFDNDGPKPAAFKVTLTTSGYGHCPAQGKAWFNGAQVDAGVNPEITTRAYDTATQVVVVKNAPLGAHGEIDIDFASCTWSKAYHLMTSGDGVLVDTIPVAPDAPYYSDCTSGGSDALAFRGSDGSCETRFWTPFDPYRLSPVSPEQALAAIEEMVLCIEVDGERVENHGLWCEQGGS